VFSGVIVCSCSLESIRVGIIMSGIFCVRVGWVVELKSIPFLCSASWVSGWIAVFSGVLVYWVFRL